MVSIMKHLQNSKLQLQFKIQNYKKNHFNPYSNWMRLFTLHQKIISIHLGFAVESALTIVQRVNIKRRTRRSKCFFELLIGCFFVPSSSAIFYGQQDSSRSSFLLAALRKPINSHVPVCGFADNSESEFLFFSTIRNIFQCI